MVQTLGEKATRDVLGPTLARLCRDGADIVCVDADLGFSTSAVKFGAEFPERFFPIGVAEQNMIGVAAGLAAAGKVAFCSSFAVFAPGHCFDQLRMAVAQPRTNVKLFASHAGVVTGEDGASAEALEDLALMLSMPPFRVIFPADAVEAEQAIEVAARTDGPFYIRALRPKTAVIHDGDYKFQLGKWPVLREGKDVTLIAVGELVLAALEAAEKLAGEGIQARVLNAASLRPLDEDALLAAAADTGAIVTAEDHFVVGGVGSLVSQVLAEKRPAPVEFVGMRDRYGTSGTWQQLLEYFNLTPDAIAKAARNAIARKSG
ncbi:MAG TPA: transketolase C-terminal domain-containing protein [Dehalococcoidia bacterium]|nr:transketolase C-terminal domain-containing protein [Dehalococcoidia bacterium]